MESSNLKFALYGGTNKCARTNTLSLPLSKVITGTVSLMDDFGPYWKMLNLFGPFYTILDSLDHY